MTAHSPLPWRVNDNWHVEDAKGGIVVYSGEFSADPHFMVRACNAHDELVAALRHIADRDTSGPIAIGGRCSAEDAARLAWEVDKQIAREALTEAGL